MGTPEIEGGKTGQIVQFKICGRDAIPTGTFIYSGTISLNLSAPSCTLEGDVNDDGKTDSVDALKIAQHLLGIIALTGDDLPAADVDDSGVVNSVDLLMVKQYLVGIRNSFPGGVYIP